FFTRSLKNPDIQRSAARHDDGLPLDGLIAKSAKLLSESGNLALILPVGRVPEALDSASANTLHLHRRTDVRGNANAPIKRSLLQWGKEPTTCVTSELVIETGQRGVYSDEYRRLTEAFYLP
ncbi:MAG: tRNA (adenosine(37)-N6)-methyltransferase TrmM, partial [Bacteroidales bacterium]|nr:tRNA (adenosine(37)-N6)-methyltransferase TrmM [Bacteroidales bacterium]